MVCPWCKGELEEGFLQSDHDVYFSPKKHNTFLGLFKADTIKLTSLDPILPTATALHCKACGRVIVEYKKQKQKT